MDHSTGRFDHIEDVLVRLHSGQWFGWSDPKNKVFANLILAEKMGVGGDLIDNPHSLPTEKSLTDALAKAQSDFDVQAYARKRKVEYPTLEELLIALYDSDDKAEVDAKRAAIKAKYPKPS